MTDVLTPIVTRFDEILRGGRGANGSLGTDAQNRAIAADTYRKALDSVSLRDPSYPLNAFDRAYCLQWTAERDADEPNNQIDDRSLTIFSCNLLVGHLAGVGHAAMIKTVGTESGATVATQPTQRAAADAFRIYRALAWYELTGSSTDPVIVWVRRSGETTREDLVDRLLTTIPLEILLSVSNTAAYTP